MSDGDPIYSSHDVDDHPPAILRLSFDKERNVPPVPAMGSMIVVPPRWIVFSCFLLSLP